MLNFSPGLCFDITPPKRMKIEITLIIQYDKNQDFIHVQSENINYCSAGWHGTGIYEGVWRGLSLVPHCGWTWRGAMMLRNVSSYEKNNKLSAILVST